MTALHLDTGVRGICRELRQSPDPGVLHSPNAIYIKREHAELSTSRTSTSPMDDSSRSLPFVTLNTVLEIMASRIRPLSFPSDVMSVHSVCIGGRKEEGARGIHE